MAVRSSMAALILRVRLLINDPQGASQVFDDQTIQDVLDEGRDDISNSALTSYPIYSGPSLQYLDYYSDLGGWEDGYALKQYLTVIVTPSVKEPIVGHWAFAVSTFPPVYITGSLHDVYRAAADLLERYAAKWVLRYNMNVDGQSLQRNQVQRGLQQLARTYRQKQRAGVISMVRSDLNSGGMAQTATLGPQPIDYMASG